MSKLMKKSWVTLLYCVGVGCGFFFMNLPLIDRNDDLFFRAMYEDLGLIAWVQRYTEIWSGRVIPHGVMLLLQQLPNVVFQLVNATMLTVLIYLGVCLITEENRNYRNVFIVLAFVLFFLVFSPNMLIFAVFWKCSTVLYVWGFVGVLAGIRPFYLTYLGKKVRIVDYVFSCIGLIYCSNFEQAAPVAIAVTSILTLYTLLERKKVPVYHYGIILITVVLLLISVTVKGNTERTLAESYLFMPYYNSFSFGDVLLFSVNYTLNFIKEQLSLLLALIGVTTAILIWKRKTVISVKVLSILPAWYYSYLYLLGLRGQIYTDPIEPSKYKSICVALQILRRKLLRCYQSR